MKRKYETEKEILAVVESFENGTMSRDDWKHAEHLTVALYYLSKDDIETATAKMRTGIFNLLRSFGVDLLKEMPYHETLTVFWMRAVADFDSASGNASILSKANDLVSTYDKDYPLKFYSRNLLFSEAARREYVGPELQA